jgi:hypothetical protein
VGELIALGEAGEASEVMVRRVTNEDLSRTLGRLEEYMAESKLQRTAIQLEVKENLAKITILSTKVDHLAAEDGKISQIEKRLIQLEAVAAFVEKGKQRGWGILLGTWIAATIIGAWVSNPISEALTKLFKH